MTPNEMTSLPWTWRGPLEIQDDDGSYWELRIDELPDFCVFGETPEEVARATIPSLRAFLESHVEHGDTVTVPKNIDQWQFLSGPGVPPGLPLKDVEKKAGPIEWGKPLEV